MLSKELQNAIENLMIKDVAFDFINADVFNKDFQFGDDKFHIQQKFWLKISKSERVR